MNWDTDEPSTSSSSSPKTRRPSNKSVHWPEKHELAAIMTTSTNAIQLPIEEQQLDGGSRRNLINLASSDTCALIDNGQIQEDSLPLLEDLFNKSAAEQLQPSINPYSRTVKDESEGDDNKQAALAELITYLEDTAALLRQHLSPAPPNADFVDNISRSEKTNFILKYQIVLVLFIQMLSILILSLIDHLANDEAYRTLGKVVGSILQFLNTLIVLFSSAVLSRQMLKHKVESSSLAQTYVATVVTFAGLYFIIYRLQPDSWEFASMDKMEESIAISQYFKMVYLSVSAATLCGAANIQPRAWYAVLLLCFQSVLNFVYFASILAQTIGNYHSYTVQVQRSNSMSRSRGKS